MAEYAAKYVSKTLQKGQKWLIFTKNNLFIVNQNYIYCAVTNAEKFESFIEIFLSVGTQMVHFSSEFASEIIFNMKRYLSCVVIRFFLYSFNKLKICCLNLC